MAELMDIDEAVAYTRQQLAANDGDALLEHIKPLAHELADHLARRPGRDLRQAGEALIEASSCVAAVAVQFDHRAESMTPLNILNIAGIELIRRADA